SSSPSRRGASLGPARSQRGALGAADVLGLPRENEQQRAAPGRLVRGMTAGVSATLAALVERVLSPAGRRARLAVFTYHQVLPERDALRPDEPDAREFAHDRELIGRVFTVLALPEA